MENTERFSNRAEGYAKYRPGYPREIVTYLQEQYGLTSGNVIADIGAGTGISTGLFLRAGYEVFAVEPNEAMLAQARQSLAAYADFHPIHATAENTNLGSGTIDAVVAGQAFHWFDAEDFRGECVRILKSRGVVALIWNERRVASSFEKEYDQLIIAHAKDYLKVNHRLISPSEIESFFAPSLLTLQLFQNEQVVDFNGLKGRLVSSSYMPPEGDEGYDVMISALQALFQRHRQNGVVSIGYDTNVYSGRLDPRA